MRESLATLSLSSSSSSPAAATTTTRRRKRWVNTSRRSRSTRQATAIQLLMWYTAAETLVILLHPHNASTRMAAVHAFLPFRNLRKYHQADDVFSSLSVISSRRPKAHGKGKYCNAYSISIPQHLFMLLFDDEDDSSGSTSGNGRSAGFNLNYSSAAWHSEGETATAAPTTTTSTSSTADGPKSSTNAQDAIIKPVPSASSTAPELDNWTDIMVRG